MLTIKYQTAFKKDYKRIVRRLYRVQGMPYNSGLAFDL